MLVEHRTFLKGKYSQKIHQNETFIFTKANTYQHFKNLVKNRITTQECKISESTSKCGQVSKVKE